MRSPAHSLSQLVQLTAPDALLRALATAGNDRRCAFGRAVPGISNPDLFDRLLANPYVVEGLCQNPYLTPPQRTRIVQHVVRKFLVPVRGRGASLLRSLRMTWGADVLTEPAWTTGLREGRALRKRGFEGSGPDDARENIGAWVTALKEAAPDMPESLLQAFFDWSWDHVRGTLHDPDLSFFARLALRHDWLFDRLADALNSGPHRISLAPSGLERFGAHISAQIAASGMALGHPGLRAFLIRSAQPSILQRAIRTAQSQPAIARELTCRLIELDSVEALSFLDTEASWLCGAMAPSDILPLLAHPDDARRYRAIMILGHVPSAAPAQCA